MISAFKILTVIVAASAKNARPGFDGSITPAILKRLVLLLENGAEKILKDETRQKGRGIKTTPLSIKRPFVSEITGLLTSNIKPCLPRKVEFVLFAKGQKD